MHLKVKQGDILQEPADVLICSANVSLNLSGGVGGEILRRFGDAMQKELHEFLMQKGIRHVQPGSVIRTSGHGTHFSTVLHAVAIDGFYDSNPELIRTAVRKALEIAAAEDAEKSP